jgi:hypothetical protein
VSTPMDWNLMGHATASAASSYGDDEVLADGSCR